MGPRDGAKRACGMANCPLISPLQTEQRESYHYSMVLVVCDPVSAARFFPAPCTLDFKDGLFRHVSFFASDEAAAAAAAEKILAAELPRMQSAQGYDMGLSLVFSPSAAAARRRRRLR